jgi:hypothetical protein
MLLKEFMYFERDRADPVENNRYLSQNDTSILRKKDLRKMRLTLKDINEIRKASEVHSKEKNEELGLLRRMYAVPPPDQGPR